MKTIPARGHCESLRLFFCILFFLLFFCSDCYVFLIIHTYCVCWPATNRNVWHLLHEKEHHHHFLVSLNNDEEMTKILLRYFFSSLICFQRRSGYSVIMENLKETVVFNSRTARYSKTVLTPPKWNEPQIDIRTSETLHIFTSTVQTAPHSMNMQNILMFLKIIFFLWF